MDILYVVKRPSMELRFSIRGLGMFGKNIGRIYIVSPEDPKFINPETVTWIRHEDMFDEKHKNILSSIEYAVNNSDISDEFLYSSDDHFYVKETDFDNYPLFCRGEIPIRKNPKNWWQNTIANTRNLLIDNGYPYYRYQIHRNTHMFRSVFETDKSLIHKSYSLNIGCDPTCLVLNSALRNGIIEYAECWADDEKLKSSMSEIEIESKIKSNECVSTTDYSFIKLPGDMLYELYCDLTKYELDNPYYLRPKHFGR